MTHNPKPETLAETKYLRLVQDAHWTYAQRPNIGAIALIGVTPAREILLIDQYRIPLRGRVIELPAGLVGDLDEFKKETLEEAAQRELREEAGYEADEWTLAINGASSAGLTDERVNLMVAHGLKQVGPGGGDEHEDIIVHHVPLDTVHEWLNEQRKLGKDIDFKVFVALYFCLGESESIV